MNSKKLIKISAAFIVGLIAAFAYYYVALPPINIHAPGFWKFIIIVLAIIIVVYGLMNLKKPDVSFTSTGTVELKNVKLNYKSKTAKVVLKTMVFVTLGVVVVFLIGSLLSSPIINASKYQKLLNVETRKFTEDIHPVSYNQIPVLDRDSAALIGSRVMGTMVDMVSQYEVSPLYSQINYQDKPVRVTPLEYGSIIKWLTNNANGIPAYIKIHMTTQETELVRLDEGIKYSESDHFGRNIYRHLRFAYPTYIFDDINFEIDDNGTPYWICPVKKYNIGLFGGVTIGKVILCNAITGEFYEYDVENAPEWVDKVYSAEMLVQLYNYYGSLKHGYFNSILSQKGCLKTTDGYNYIALEDDVWVYTGITSVGNDRSNVGFVLMNQRTMETRYYEISGAEEYSAMSSAEGKVQHLGYKATFPLLLNVGGQPTYFMALKDSAGLVKQYAMLNIEKYQTVATGNTVGECEKEYLNMMDSSGITTESKKEDIKNVSGVITKMAQTVVEGNSHYYVILDNSSEIYDISVVDYIDIIKYNIGDSIKLEYHEGDKVRTVTAIK